MARDNGTGLISSELMARVRQIQLRTHQLVDDALAGAYRSAFRGSGIEFEEVRPYQPGDDVRSIDWNRTARGQGAFIKTFTEERELTLDLLVDTSRSMDFGSRDVTKREQAATLCALLAFVALRGQDRVGLRLFGREPHLHLEPAKGSGAVLRLVREVLAHEPTDGAADLAAVLEQEGRTLRRRALVFMVSDFHGLTDVSLGAELTRRCHGFARRHDLVLVRVVDPLEEALPRAGLMRLGDLESGFVRELDTRSARVRQAWSEAARERKRVFQELVSRAQLDSIELSTVQSVAEPVIGFFRRRGRRRR